MTFEENGIRTHEEYSNSLANYRFNQLSHLFNRSIIYNNRTLIISILLLNSFVINNNEFLTHLTPHNILSSISFFVSCIWTFLRKTSPIWHALTYKTIC